MDSERNLHCCRSMTEHLENESADEALVFYSAAQNAYGLPDRKDDIAYTPISYCPWCGTRLPSLDGITPDEPFSTA